MKLLILTITSLLAVLPSFSQKNEILDERIASLTVVAGDDWLSPPVVRLGGDVPINISFDDLTHEYHRYAYRIEHCESDWSKSDGIFTSDFCEGFDEGNTIDDIAQSINTNTQYTHYKLQLPNDKCRMKMSGNYRVTIYDENDGKDVATVCFMVCEPNVGISMSVSPVTDIDINKAHQQVAFQINYGSLKVINPQNEIKTVVMQNGRWDNAAVNPKPQFTMQDGLKWEHNRQLIFDGGNEYRKFELLDVSHTTMGLESIKWDGSNYHAFVWTDEPRRSYVYDKDANGSFYIRNSDNIENDVSSEYAFVHFRLKSEKMNEPVYINAGWTNDLFVPSYEMEYDAEQQCYIKTLFLKQGYYSYQYLLLKPDGTTCPVPSEGNFCYTENKYQCLVYYRGVGQRTDRLVGYKQVTIN